MSYYQQGGGGGKVLWFFVFIIAAIFVLLMISRNPAFKNWLAGLMKGVTTPVTPPTTPQTPQTPPPSSGGSSATGTNVYQVVREISPTDGTRVSEASNNSQRDNQGYDCSICSREATWIFNPNGADDVSIKMGSHEGDSSSLIEFATDGQRWRCEGPHMTYNDLSGSGSLELGTTQVGVKGISWNVSGSTNHHEIWFNADGSGNSWEKVAEYEGGADGCNDAACPVPGDSCQDTLRMDDPPDGWQFISRSIVEIVPGQLATGGSTGGTTPPTTTPPTTTPPAGEEEEEEDEEEEPEEEEEEDEEPPATTPPASGGTCPASCEPLRNSAPQTYQACCNASGSAARSPRRRANTARGLLRDGMFIAYNQPDYWNYDEYLYRRRENKQIEANRFTVSHKRGKRTQRIGIGNLI